MAYTEEKRLMIEKEAKRLSKVIKEHATEKHVAWQNATPEGLKGFDGIVLGAVTIILEMIKPGKICDERDLLLMLETDRITAQEMCESYTVVAKMETKSTEALRSRISPVAHYLYNATMIPHMENCPADAMYDCNRLAVEAISILKKNLPKV